MCTLYGISVKGGGGGRGEESEIGGDRVACTETL